MPEDITEGATDSEASASLHDPPKSSQSALYKPGVEASAHFDLVIIGASPAALAVISRILESRPAALYTEDEHRHLHFTHRRHASPLIPSKFNISPPGSTDNELKACKKGQGRKRRSKAVLNSGMGEECPCDGRIKILVIDRLGEGFMGLWRRNFRALGISHLRSPMFFHPDASDFDSLIAFANQRGKAGEGTPDQVIDLIERRVATGSTVDASHGKSVGKHSKTKDGVRRRSLEEPNALDKRDPNDSSLPDLIEILGVVGKEKSKHKRKQQISSGPTNKVHVNERDRRDYFTPSSALFDDFTRTLEQKYRVQPCDDCCSNTWPKVSQYFEAQSGIDSTGEIYDSGEGELHGLGESPVMTLQGRVKELAWFDGAQRTIQDDFGNHHPGFFLSLDDGHGSKEDVVISAKAVVCAVGFGGMPAIPPYITSPPPLRTPAAAPPPACGPGWMHSSCLASCPFPSPRSVSRQTTMVVVGGGLTSAQIVVRALEQGFDKVILLLRGHLKSKPFDVDLGWVGRYSNYLKMQFWQNDDVQERLNTLRAARNGGSVTPTYAKVLSRLQALGKLEIKTHTVIVDARYSRTTVLDNRATKAAEKEAENRRGEGVAADAGAAHVVDEGGDNQWTLRLRSNPDNGQPPSVIRCDYLMLATGAKIDFSSLPFLSTLHQTPPTRVIGGMPVLTADLEYRRDVPLFVTGAYAGLQIGPAAGNLGGMRDSADRIANRLLELLRLPETNPPVKGVERELAEEGADRVDNVKDASSTFTHFNFDLLSIEA